MLDILRGRAVHARGGRREDYGPVRSILRRGDDPLGLAAALRDAFGPAELYVADLDAIAGAPPDLDLYRRLASVGPSLWLDAGLRDGDGLAALLEAGVGRLVVGSETVDGPGAVRRIVDRAGPDRVVFSLDLRDGRPIVAEGSDWRVDDLGAIVAAAVEARVGTVLLLDLARVGSGRGAGTGNLLEGWAGIFPGVEWVVGGGIAGPEDVAALGRAGASAVLVASALHDGRISARMSGGTGGATSTL